MAINIPLLSNILKLIKMRFRKNRNHLAKCRIDPILNVASQRVKRQQGLVGDVFVAHLWTHLSRSSADRQEKYRGGPADSVTWKQCSRPSTDGWSGLMSTPPAPKSSVCIALWPASKDSCDRLVRSRGGTMTLQQHAGDVSTRQTHHGKHRRKHAFFSWNCLLSLILIKYIFYTFLYFFECFKSFLSPFSRL